MRGTLWWLVPVGVCAVSLAFIAWALSLKPSHYDAEVLACDRAVHELLTTHDWVEFERARFIVRQFNCGIGRRLP